MSSQSFINYQIKLASSFKKSYQKLVKSYYKKNTKGTKLLDEQIEKYVELLAYDPAPPIENARSFNDSIKRIEQQKFNSTQYLPQWDFKKLYFVCPGQNKGPSSMGRLMYIIDESRKTVYLLYIYNHHQWESRPPDNVMNDIFKSLKRDEYDG